MLRRKSIRLAMSVMAVLAAGLAGCGGYMAPAAMTGITGAPMIAELSPSNVTAGSPGFVLTIMGSNFGTDSVVFFNSIQMATGYVTGNQLTLQVTMQEVASRGQIPVYVRSGGRNSNTVNLTVE